MPFVLGNYYPYDLLYCWNYFDAPLFAFLEGLWAVGFAPELKRSVADAVRQHRLEMCIADSSFAFC